MVASELLRKRIEEALVDGQLPCAEAFRIAREVRVSPAEVGRTADELGVRISRCQLGLFGYGPKAEGKHRIVQPLAEVPAQLSEAVRERLVDGRLPCAVAWSLARRFGLTRLEVSGAAEALGIRISRCQLGCF